MNFKDRLPSRAAILQVYAIIALMIYGWTIGAFFWKFPSWLFFLTVGDILVLFAYAMVSALFESLILLGILLLVCLLLPAAWMRDSFATRGTSAAVFGIGFLMAITVRFTADIYSWISDLPLWLLAGLAATVLFTFASARVRAAVRAAAWISDRAVVLLFLFTPVSLVSLVVVLYRNLF